MSETVNPTLTKVEDAVKSIVWDSALQGALASLFTAAPWLNVPPLRQIVTGVAELAGNKFYAYLRLGVDLGAISFMNAEAQRQLDRASVTLKIIALNKGIESEDFKRARDEARRALARFCRFNG